MIINPKICVTHFLLDILLFGFSKLRKLSFSNIQYLILIILYKINANIQLFSQFSLYYINQSVQIHHNTFIINSKILVLYINMQR
jgi:hypothetical protein